MADGLGTFSESFFYIVIVFSTRKRCSKAKQRKYCTLPKGCDYKWSKRILKEKTQKVFISVVIKLIASVSFTARLRVLFGKNLIIFQLYVL